MKKKKRTQEQIEARRIYMVEYRKKNKDKLKIYSAEYHKKNKEAKRIYDAERKKNRTPEQKEAFRIRNNEQKRKSRAKFKTPYWVVYILPKENYVGMTQNFNDRLIGHKSVGRDITDARILHEIETEEMARRQENLYHNIGFEGGKGLRYIRKGRSGYEVRVRVKSEGLDLRASSLTLEEAHQCRYEFYNRDNNINYDKTLNKFEIDRLC